MVYNLQSDCQKLTNGLSYKIGFGQSVLFIKSLDQHRNSIHSEQRPLLWWSPRTSRNPRSPGRTFFAAGLGTGSFLRSSCCWGRTWPWPPCRHRNDPWHCSRRSRSTGLGPGRRCWRSSCSCRQRTWSPGPLQRICQGRPETFNVRSLSSTSTREQPRLRGKRAWDHSDLYFMCKLWCECK